MYKLGIFTVAVLTFVQVVSISSIAKTEAMDEELFSLCSSFPQNSRCEAFNAPIALDDRPGEKAKCLIDTNSDGQSCKVNLADGKLSVYGEEGEALSVLDGEKNTKELTFPIKSIQSIQYSEDEKINVGAVIAFGVWGLLAPKDVAQVRLSFQPQGEDSAKQVAILASKKIGGQLKEDLESETGKTAELFFGDS